jgi:hypothetical protein
VHIAEQMPLIQRSHLNNIMKLAGEQIDLGNPPLWLNASSSGAACL